MLVLAFSYIYIYIHIYTYVLYFLWTSSLSPVLLLHSYFLTILHKLCRITLFTCIIFVYCSYSCDLLPLPCCGVSFHKLTLTIHPKLTMPARFRVCDTHTSSSCFFFAFFFIFFFLLLFLSLTFLLSPKPGCCRSWPFLHRTCSQLSLLLLLSFCPADYGGYGAPAPQVYTEQTTVTTYATPLAGPFTPPLVIVVPNV